MAVPQYIYALRALYILWLYGILKLSYSNKSFYVYLADVVFQGVLALRALSRF